MKLQSVREEHKEKVFAFRWDAELRDEWVKIASRLNRNEAPSSAARELLQEYIACFLTDDQLEQMGLVAYKTYPPPRIALAMESAERMRKGFRDTEPMDPLGVSHSIEEKDGGNRKKPRSRRK